MCQCFLYREQELLQRPEKEEGFKAKNTVTSETLLEVLNEKFFK